MANKIQNFNTGKFLFISQELLLLCVVQRDFRVCHWKHTKSAKRRRVEKDSQFSLNIIVGWRELKQEGMWDECVYWSWKKLPFSCGKRIRNILGEPFSHIKKWNGAWKPNGMWMLKLSAKSKKDLFRLQSIIFFHLLRHPLTCIYICCRYVLWAEKVANERFLHFSYFLRKVTFPIQVKIRFSIRPGMTTGGSFSLSSFSPIAQYLKSRAMLNWRIKRTQGKKYVSKS